MRRLAAFLSATAFASTLVAAFDPEPARADGSPELERTIERLEERSGRAPEDGELLRDLGLAYLDAGQYDKAIARLSKASRIVPDDPSIPLLTGLCREAREEWAGAIEAYRAYPAADRAPAVGRTVRGRMARLVRLVYAERASALIETPAEPAPGLLVVRYFDILAETGTYGNLGKGIADILISDLSRVRDIVVVPRLSYEALRQEVERSRAAGHDPLALASMDAMLGAGWALGGTILPREESDEIRLDYFLVNNTTGEISPPVSLSGPLSDFIPLEKRIVLDVLDRLGVGLDEGDRSAIRAIPTTHFRAFLAYGNALDAEDRGDFAGARAAYEQALRFDPHFALAAERAERTMGSAEAIRSIALEEIALPGDRRALGRIERTASLLLPSPLPERGEASDLSNVRPWAGAELLIRVDRP